MPLKLTDKEQEIINDWKRLVDQVYDDPELQEILCDYDRFRAWEDQQIDKIVAEYNITVQYFIEIHLKLTGWQSTKQDRYENELKSSFSDTDV